MDSTEIKNKVEGIVSANKVTILLLARNSLPYIIYTIDSILNHTKTVYNILIVESESTDGTGEYLDWLASSNNNIEVLHTKKEGVIKAFNI